MWKKKLFLGLAAACGGLFLAAVYFMLVGFLPLFQGERIEVNSGQPLMLQAGTYKLLQEYQEAGHIHTLGVLASLQVQRADGVQALIEPVTEPQVYSAAVKKGQLLGDLVLAEPGEYVFTAKEAVPLTLRVTSGVRYVPFMSGLVLLHISVFGGLGALYASSRARRTYLRIVKVR